MSFLGEARPAALEMLDKDPASVRIAGSLGVDEPAYVPSGHGRHPGNGGRRADPSKEIDQSEVTDDGGK
eukprot:9422935-Alexandrium_andersonii.AAC.1